MVLHCTASSSTFGAHPHYRQVIQTCTCWSRRPPKNLMNSTLPWMVRTPPLNLMNNMLLRMVKMPPLN